MFILNATKEVKSIMSDNGVIVSVGPGEVSQLIIASKNQIRAAMNLGSPKEVGIILDGSYDLALAKDISGAQPYLYTDIEEAKAKLIDPSIDYKAKLAGTLEINVLRGQLESKELDLKAKDAMIATLQANIDKLKAEDVKIELENKVRELEGRFHEAESDKLRLNSQLKDTQEQLRLINDTVSGLRKEVGDKDQELVSINKLLQEKVEKLTTVEQQLANQASEKVDLSEYVSKEEYSRLEAELTKKIAELTHTNDTYKESLQEASNTIEAMKSSFNEACEKFSITRDENGEWIQILDECAN